jgi:hypothetical protein
VRIVPRGYGLRDSPTVRQLKEDSAFIREHDPGYEAVDLGREFVEVVCQHERTLRARYDVWMRDRWPDDLLTAARAAQGRDHRLA